MWLLLVSGYQRVGVVPYSFLCHFVLIVTLNDLKTFLNGFINMVCYFIVLCTSLWKRYDLSVEKGIFLWISMYFNVLRSSDLSEQFNSNSQKCQGGADKFYQGLRTQKYQSFL